MFLNKLRDWVNESNKTSELELFAKKRVKKDGEKKRMGVNGKRREQQSYELLRYCHMN